MSFGAGAKNGFALYVQIEDSEFERQIQKIQSAFNTITAKLNTIVPVASQTASASNTVGSASEFARMFDGVAKRIEEVKDTIAQSTGGLIQKTETKSTESINATKEIKETGVKGGENLLVQLRNIATSILPLIGIAVSVGSLVALITESSPLLRNILAILNQGILFMLRPIADFIGILLTPVSYLFLKWSLDFYRHVFPYLKPIAEAMGKMLANFFDNPLGSLLGLAEAIGKAVVSNITFGVKLPEITIPKFSFPDFKFPELPKFSFPELPKFSFPEMPKITWPEIPKIKFPDLPKFSFPDLPKFKFPELPDLKFPELPKFKFPELPKFEFPKFPELPESIKGAIDELKGVAQRIDDFLHPKIPATEAPNVTGKLGNAPEAPAPAGADVDKTVNPWDRSTKAPFKSPPPEADLSKVWKIGDLQIPKISAIIPEWAGQIASTIGKIGTRIIGALGEVSSFGFDWGLTQGYGSELSKGFLPEAHAESQTPSLASRFDTTEVSKTVQSLNENLTPQVKNISDTTSAISNSSLALMGIANTTQNQLQPKWDGLVNVFGSIYNTGVTIGNYLAGAGSAIREGVNKIKDMLAKINVSVNIPTSSVGGLSTAGGQITVTTTSNSSLSLAGISNTTSSIKRSDLISKLTTEQKSTYDAFVYGFGQTYADQWLKNTTKTPASTTIIAAAQGYSGDVSKPTFFMAGEAGVEHVEITPSREMPNLSSLSRLTEYINKGANITNNTVSNDNSKSAGKIETVEVNMSFAIEKVMGDLDLDSSVKPKVMAWFLEFLTARGMI